MATSNSTSIYTNLTDVTWIIAEGEGKTLLKGQKLSSLKTGKDQIIVDPERHFS